MTSDTTRIAAQKSFAAPDFDCAEEKRDLGHRRFRGIRTVHRVLLDVDAQIPANGPSRRLERICPTHQLAPARNRLIPLQHRDGYWSRRHVGAERGVEWPRLMNLIKLLGLNMRQAHQLERADSQTRRLNSL